MHGCENARQFDQSIPNSEVVAYENAIYKYFEFKNEFPDIGIQNYVNPFIRMHIEYKNV